MTNQQLNLILLHIFNIQIEISRTTKLTNSTRNKCRLAEEKLEAAKRHLCSIDLTLERESATTDALKLVEKEK